MPSSSPRDPHHVVSFYDGDDAVCQMVADFVADGLALQEDVVVMATAGHWKRTKGLLAAAGVDVAQAIRRRHVAFLDAESILRRITVHGAVDTVRFAALLQAALARTARPFRVFGEVVSLVAARSGLADAVAIEQLGHQLAHETPATVLCAYDLRHLDGGAAEQVARCHDRAIGQPAALPTGPTVLLADDYEDSRDLYREYLEFRGYHTVTAADGVEAVEQARACRPALILLDVRMPRMSGVEAMQALKRDPQFAGVPIAALTAHALDTERELFLSAGFDAVLAKPCLPEELVRTVEALLGSSQPAASRLPAL
jgi:CheY-like chemotaxis protein